MATSYSTPGVYVEEISTLAPSVASVATAIPAFIGYTEKGPLLKPTRIDTMLDYENLFGGANPSAFSVAVNNPGTDSQSIGAITRTDAKQDQFLMYYGLSLYFQNGGGSCYIISVGNYSATPAKADFIPAIAALEKEDEPTLIVLIDATPLKAADYYSLCTTALAQCKKLGDRFLIVDVPKGEKIDDFRTGIGSNNLSYAAVYYPYLTTTLNFQYKETDVKQTAVGKSFQITSNTNGVNVIYTGAATDVPKIKIATDADVTTGKAEFTVSSGANNIKTLEIKIPIAAADVLQPTGTEMADLWAAWKNANAAGGFNVTINGTGGDTVAAITLKNIDAVAATEPTLSDLKGANTGLYNQIKTSLSSQRVELPPSAAVAGVYASVDRDRGVWKAPANVSLNSVIGPVSKISDVEQDSLNIDPTAGKSINAIRTFTGKGTLVWGGRTLAGNDNEWRYVSVRRLFITIEESTRKASAFAVFEPNDATTWLKVKAMIESYLYGLWQQGALAGSKPESAYFVSVGLGKTMTAQDILEGKLIVTIGVAAVRPAEFIVLRFSHKLQEA
ncbi:phage tail sheath C-terminal domain-containing protein [Methylobacter sp. Wu8]|uniref:phage tail sheath family protein n=1 Tax=Methylobacter sp. Wu8 TaxID=3118457 RepID=UPI002F3325FC